MFFRKKAPAQEAATKPNAALDFMAAAKRRLKAQDAALNRKRVHATLLWFFVVAAIEAFRDGTMPTVRTEPTAAEPVPFRAEAAHEHISKLAGLGPRVVGMKVNEVLAPKMIEYELVQIKEKNEATASLATIDIDIQTVSGAFHHDEFLGGMTVIYQNVKNVVCRVSWPGADLSSAVLVNAHYDSAPGSQGASDDLMGIGVMIELVRSLAAGEALPRPVIFLFNGAEEANQPAAHGFITRHEWAPSVRAVVNLESLGAGGREMMFQCNDVRAAAVYGASVPRPRASVIAHELFAHILHRTAATDLRTFWEHSPRRGVVGVDFAHIQDGYRYHTTHDVPEAIALPSLRHTGENMLALVRGFANSDAAMEAAGDAVLGSISPFGDAGTEGLDAGVFFDFAGLWVVAYSSAVSTVANLAVLAAAVFVVFRVFRGSASAMGAALAGEAKALLATTLAPAVLGLVAWRVAPMRWYAGGISVAVALFVPPALLANLVARRRVVAAAERRVAYAVGEPHEVVALVAGGALLLWAALLTVAQCLSVRSGYLATVWLLFGTAALALFGGVVPDTVSRGKTGDRRWFLCYLTPAALLWAQTVRGILCLVVPLLGRTGSAAPPDPILGALIGLLVGLGLAVPGAVLSTSCSAAWTKSVARVFAAASVAMLAFAALFLSSYSAAHPKRFWILHVAREGHRRNGGKPDSGLLFQPFDNQGMAPLAAHPPANRYFMSGGGDYAAKCRPTKCYTEFPYYYPIADVMTKNSYTSAMPPKTPPETDLSVRTRVSKTEGGGKKVRLTLSGPSHMGLAIDDGAGGERLKAWSLLDAGVPAPRWEGIYYVQLTSASAWNDLLVAKYEFELEFDGDADVRIGVYAHYVSVTETMDLDEAYVALPDWAKGGEFCKFAARLRTVTL